MGDEFSFLIEDLTPQISLKMLKFPMFAVDGICLLGEAKDIHGKSHTWFLCPHLFAFFSCLSA